MFYFSSFHSIRFRFVYYTFLFSQTKYRYKYQQIKLKFTLSQCTLQQMQRSTGWKVAQKFATCDQSVIWSDPIFILSTPTMYCLYAKSLQLQTEISCLRQPFENREHSPLPSFIPRDTGLSTLFYEQKKQTWHPLLERKRCPLTGLLFQKQKDHGSRKLVQTLQIWLYKRKDKRKKYQVPGLWCIRAGSH